MNPSTTLPPVASISRSQRTLFSYFHAASHMHTTLHKSSTLTFNMPGSAMSGGPVVDRTISGWVLSSSPQTGNLIPSTVLSVNAGQCLLCLPLTSIIHVRGRETVLLIYTPISPPPARTSKAPLFTVKRSVEWPRANDVPPVSISDVQLPASESWKYLGLRGTLWRRKDRLSSIFANLEPEPGVRFGHFPNLEPESAFAFGSTFEHVRTPKNFNTTIRVKAGQNNILGPLAPAGVIILSSPPHQNGVKRAEGGPDGIIVATGGETPRNASDSHRNPPKFGAGVQFRVWRSNACAHN
ncbi:hypothetical protein FB45DRAFT_1005540 [Roridomyces roridus]|uniref:Uncharacterized protein n=1 Tax=Roridomyces roridus TaxID=1738132 RepID=A0AAD7FKR4_9AGAR|nr:hypothetical protein FB45DRAFT_1005540 [Roridomyces roridus]